MIDSITTNLFVILVYLVPGSIITFVIYLTKPSILFFNNTRHRNTNLQAIYLLTISLFFGVILTALTNMLSLGLQIRISKKAREEWQKWVQEETSQGQKEGYFYLKWKSLEERNDNNYVLLNRNFDPVKYDVDYFFAAKRVKEHAQKESETVYRIEAFYLLCLNCMIPLAILLLVVFRYKLRRLKKNWLWFSLTLLATESILFVAACNYICALTFAVLSTLVVLK